MAGFSFRRLQYLCKLGCLNIKNGDYEHNGDKDHLKKNIFIEEKYYEYTTFILLLYSN